MAKLIDSASSEATKTELDLFLSPPTQVVIEKCKWKEIQLQNPCTNEGPYEFHIAPDPQMLQLAKNYLLVELRIRAGNVDLQHDQAAVNNVVGPINLIAKTFIKQVRLQLNGTEVFDSGEKYAFRAFLETELNYGEEAKTGQLTAAGYKKDEPGDKIDTIENQGFLSRCKQFRGSVWVQFIAPIHCDLFACERYLLNNVDLRLTLQRNTDAFCLTSLDAAPDYKLEISTMKWYVKGVTAKKDVLLGIEHVLQSKPAMYPVRRVEVKSLHVGEGRWETPENAVFNGQLPRRLIVGCVDGEAYHGVYKKSPFNFKNFNITEISVNAGGETFPSKPIAIDFPNNKYAGAFMQLFDGQGIGGENRGNGIDIESFKNGSCLFAFDLSPDEDDRSAHWDLVRDGATIVKISFGTAAPAQGIEVIVYAEFDNLITIDRNRNTFTDFHA